MHILHKLRRIKFQIPIFDEKLSLFLKKWLFYWNIHTVSYNCSCHIANIIKVSLMKTLCTLTDEIWFIVSINGSNLSCDKHEEANSHNDK